MKLLKNINNVFKSFKRSFHLKRLDSMLTKDLYNDSSIKTILKSETKRQLESLELIASENFTSRAVLQARNG